MSEVEGTEIIEDEKIEKAPAEELVEMILSGELHAANQKFGELVEGKVIEAIEEEKHKIAQTLFAEEEIEEAKAKVKEDDEDGDGDDDDVEPDDDDDEEDEDDSPVGKADEGKIPPQFLKKGDDDSDDEEDDDDDKEDDDDDDDDGKSKKGKVPPQFAKKEGVEPVDELSNKKLADAQNKAGEMALAGSKKAEEQGAKFKRAQQQDRKTADGKPISVSDRTKTGVRQLTVKDKLKKAATKGAEKLGLKKRPERATANPYGPERMSRPGDHRYGKAPVGAEHFDPEQSFDPGEESTNVKLPENSFVAQVARHLSGTGYIKEDLGRDIENGFKKLSNKKAKAGKQDSFEGSAIKCGDYKITPGKTHDASDTTPGADENIAFYVSVQDSSGKEVTDQIDASGGGDAIDFDTETGKMSSSDKKTAKEIEKWCKS